MSTDSRPDTSGTATAPGDLGRRLLELAIATTTEHGPAALSLRDLQRRAGVSPAAAYRHYRDRDALLRAVGRHSSSRLADHIAAALDRVRQDRPDLDGHALAVARLRVGCEAYLSFADTSPGLYRALFWTHESPGRLSDPAPPARGETAEAAQRGPFQLLQECLADLDPALASTGDELDWNAITVWSACHGFASLLLDSALDTLDAAQRAEGRARILEILLAGLSARGAGPA